MRFNPRARLDTSRTSDLGGGGGLGGGGMRLPGGRAGGGIGSILLIVVVLAVGQCTGVGPSVNDVLGGSTGGLALDSQRLADPANTDRYAQCRTGEDANSSSDCARVAVENSLTEFWESQFDSGFQPAQRVVTFTGGVSTGGCGNASADVGPFYCPVDQTIYLDTTFFQNVLQQQLGGPAGPFVEPYVLAHEYGHHIQNLLGAMNQVRTQQGPKSDAVRLELQADCYAGMWARAAETVPNDDGEVLIEDLTEQDIREAIDAATAVGDDYIQHQTGGRVNPESWTHGSSEQRVRWFQTGYQSGSVQACDTWATDDL